MSITRTNARSAIAANGRIVNAFFWLLDASGPGGINWSFIITAGWGFALAFHAPAYWVDGHQVEERKTEQYLREEHDRD